MGLADGMAITAAMATLRSRHIVGSVRSLRRDQLSLAICATCGAETCATCC